MTASYHVEIESCSRVLRAGDLTVVDRRRASCSSRRASSWRRFEVCWALTRDWMRAFVVLSIMG